MTSIARTLTLSLGMAAAVIFFAALGLVFWLFIAKEPERSACFAAAYVLGRATEVNPGNSLTVRPTARLEELNPKARICGTSDASGMPERLPGRRLFSRIRLRTDDARWRYRTTPDVNPALRRGGLISFFRKQCASRPA
ncbi:hypothetical protein [Bradyrhizobium erythrophlei]|uniref:Uncharacterized protein n=1 Tax=Bradyrhizobium erythrophlei TaxID=1437360 RepID=A0A1H4ZUB3_9BRAD|nr:hypothetical protein [Bradyrhizobium erythrophlei]SED33051.1 hypothetical protein SAMN05444164_4457 [Bradyrhizobium erythrophlei]